MRTTVILDDKLLEEAQVLTGIKRTSDLLNEGLSEIIRKEAALRLASLGGSMTDAFVPGRRIVK